MKFDSASYKFLKTVNFSGYTFSFAAIAAGSGNDIVYTFCDTDASAEDAKDNQSKDAGSGERGQSIDQNKRESSDDRKAREESEEATAAGEDHTADIDNSWTPLTVLDFPCEFRPIGMTLLTRPATSETSPTASTTAPFAIVIDNINLWIIRRTSDATSLLADRFIFDTGAKRLVKANEVRFTRSGNPDIPATDRDTYGLKDPDGNAFVEPTFLIRLNSDELHPIGDDSTAALLIPDAGNPKRGRWHFFLSNNNGTLNHYTIAYTEFAWFDLTDVGLNDEAVSLISSTGTGVVNALDTLSVSDRQLSYPTATVYEQQETAFTQVGEAQSVKRAVRAALSCQATASSGGTQPVLAVFDFSIGLDGHLTRIPSNPLTVQPIEDYNTVLKFDGRGDYAVSETYPTSSIIGTNPIISCWIRWDGSNTDESEQTIVSLTPDDNVPMALIIDTKARPCLKFGLGSEDIIKWPVPLIPGQWINLSFGIIITSGLLQAQLWLNGLTVGKVSPSIDGVVSIPQNLQLCLGSLLTEQSDLNSTESFFNGAFGQFYILSSFGDFEGDLLGLPNNYIYNSPKTDSSIKLFLDFNEGQGTTLTDSSTKGRNCTINGAIWEPDVSPAQPSMPVAALDDNFLDIRAALLSPTANGSLPAVPATGCAPSFMNSGDGLLHLYYRSSGDSNSDLTDKAAAVHMSTSAERARFVVLQKDVTYQGDDTSQPDETSGETSQPDETSSDEPTQMLTLVSRQAGRGGGMINIDFGDTIIDGNGNKFFEKVTFEFEYTVTNSTTGTETDYSFSESWKNVPARLDEFTQVINGLAAVPYTLPTYAINSGHDQGDPSPPFTNDKYYDSDNFSDSTENPIDLSGVTNPAPMAVYQSERAGESLLYTLPGLTRATFYKVRLHFAEIYFTSPDERVFDVEINGIRVLSNFDIFKQAGGQLKALVKEFEVAADSDGNITIHGITGTANYPKFSGIEILAQASDSSESSEQIEAEHGQVVYDYANNVTLTLPSGTTRFLSDQAVASSLFEVFPNQKLLDQNPVPSLQAQDNLSITVFAGRDCGWLKMPLQPCMQFTGSTVAYVNTDPDAPDYTPAPGLDIPGDLTVQCWFFMEEAPGAESVIAIFRGDQASYALAINSDQQLVAYRFGFFPLESESAESESAESESAESESAESESAEYYGVSRSSVASSLDTNKWIHVAAVYQASYGLHLPTNVYIDCGHGKNVDITEAITIEAWVKFDNNDPGTADIVSKTSYESGQSSYELSVITDGSGNHRHLQLTIWQDDGTKFPVKEGFDCAAGVWTHLAATYHPDLQFNFFRFKNKHSNYLEIDPVPPMNTFTVEMLIRPITTNTQAFISLNRLEKDPTMNYFLVNYPSEDPGQLYVQIEGAKIKIPGSEWKQQTWNFLSVVVETVGQTTSLTVYINGKIIPINLPPAGLSMASPSSSEFHAWTVGGEWDDGQKHIGDYMTADVSEVRIWSTARTEAEILSTLYLPLTGAETGLAAYLLFNADANSHQSFVPDRVSGEMCDIQPQQDPNDSDFDVSVYTWDSYYLEGKSQLYVNGDQLSYNSATDSSTGPGKTICSTDTPLTIGRQAIIASSPGTDDRHLNGTIDNVRLWRYALQKSQINYFRLNPVPNPVEQPGLAAFWAFNEGRGDRISDSAGGSVGKITGMRFVQAQDADELWIPTPFDADWKIYINGTEADCYDRELLTKDTSAHHSKGLVIGAEEKSAYSAALNAFLGEVQIWNTARSGEDISRTMNQPAVVGLQEGLQGYYRFNDGSGENATDSSDNNYDAVVTGEEWFTADNYGLLSPFTDQNIPPIPMRDEAPEIVTISNGYVSDEATALNISYTPSVVEDRSGQKRIYTYLTKSDGDSGSTGGEILLQADVPLAETELVYLGQMQYRPRLIGFIEGAPPVPSENLTVDSSSTPDRYVNNTSVQLKRSDTANVSAEADLTRSIGISANVKGSFDLSEDATTEEGFYEGLLLAGAFEGAAEEVLKGEEKINFTMSSSGDVNFSASEKAAFNETVNKSFALNVDGGWENNCYTIPGDITNTYFIAGQRLYRPNNMGSAIVKSRTADLYAVRSKKTQAMLGYKVIPNPEIPEDINILMFKINPQYIKNGTLDGYIGFDKDIDYNNLAAGRKGSFFKPEEAYRLKGTIERETRRAASDLSQYNPVGGFTSWHDKLTRQSLVNTYVWTADGGTLSLESQFSTSFQESFSGGLDIKGSIGGGGSFKLDAGFGILAGMSTSFEELGNGTLNLSYSHSDDETTAISLNSDVQGEGFLYRVLVPPTDFNTDPTQWSECVDELHNNSTITQDDTPSLYHLFTSNNITLSKKNYVTPEAPNADPTSSEGPWIAVDLYTRYKIQTIQNDGTNDGTKVLKVSYWPVGADDSQYNVNYDFASPPCPGKVRGYRFMSFYLAPNKNNFNAFFAQGDDQIVDPEWLAGTDPDAVALRQAAHVKNEVWRVMHRVTYVNRVPPAPQDMLTSGEQTPQAEDVASQPVRPDDHSIRHNSIIVDRVLAAAYPAGTVTTQLEDLDFDTITLNSANFDDVATELNKILQDMGIDDEPERTLYFNEMMTFFQLLLTPNEKQQAD